MLAHSLFFLPSSSLLPMVFLNTSFASHFLIFHLCCLPILAPSFTTLLSSVFLLPTLSTLSSISSQCTSSFVCSRILLPYRHRLIYPSILLSSSFFPYFLQSPMTIHSPLYSFQALSIYRVLPSSPLSILLPPPSTPLRTSKVLHITPPRPFHAPSHPLRPVISHHAPFPPRPRPCHAPRQKVGHVWLELLYLLPAVGPRLPMFALSVPPHPSPGLGVC